MHFQSLLFLAFLAVTVVVSLTVSRRNQPVGRWLLLTACVVFYLGGLPSQTAVDSLLVLAASACVTWFAVRDFQANPHRKKGMAGVASCWLLGTLLIYKYMGFFSGGTISIGWVPLGLSFFTFQQLWYLREAYTGKIPPAPLGDYLLFSFFFPTITSGPILRPSAFFSQLRSEAFLRPDERDAAAALYAISMGMAKKVLLADSLGVVVDHGWSMGAGLGLPGAWVVILAYTLQLYLDFSGYCDIAAGCARLLGLRLPVNFNSPYRALSVGEFWKRWHITLTTFLRECLYFPLGGSRKGSGRTYVNILIIYLVSGFWHGAGWTFIVWGVLHGLAQIVERIWGAKRERLPKIIQWALTFLFVNLAWVFFRAPSLSAAWTMLSTAVSGGMEFPLEALAAGVLDSEVIAISTLLPVLAKGMPGLVLTALLGVSLGVALWPRNVIQKMETIRPRLGGALVCGVLLVWAVLSFSSGATFIYSNF